MFKLSEKDEIDRKSLNYEYIKYSPSEISAINTPNSQMYINITREDSVICLLNSFLELNFDVLQAAPGNRYADANDIRLINRGVIALFSIYILTTSSGKHLEEIILAHVISLMYKLLSSSIESDDLSIDFDRSRDRRKKRELTNKKNIKGKYQLRIFLKDVFGFCEHQEVASYGLGYKLTTTRNTDNGVLNKDNAVNNAKIKTNSLKSYVPLYTPILNEYNKLRTQIKQKTLTNLQYPEKSVFMKEVNTQVFWTFDLGVQEGINVPIWIFLVFQQMDRQNDHNLNNEYFVRLPVISVQVVIETERYPDTGILLNYCDDDYRQGYGQIKEAYKTLTKDDILQPYISENDFRSSNDGDIICYNIHAFDIRYQKNFEGGQSVKVEFKFDRVIPAGIYGYALVSTSRLISISSDGQRMFDIT